MNVWIRHPKIWEAAEKLTAERLPRDSASFWRRVLEEYKKRGGRTEETEAEPEGAEQ